ncbi:MAG: sporulation protein [Firmicutes bacterium HGW-Firmicutes-16]|nr:MAG: sporulation protein [Firmicutes bacterium HGW-Firmicutes-16]
MDQSNSVQSNLTENVDSLFRSLENFTQREGIIGKAVIQGDKTFLPVVSITVGYGGGNASMKGQAGVGMGANANTGTGALGLGAKLCTDGIIVVDKQDVSLLPMNSAAAVSLVDKIPQIISGMTQQKQANQQTQGQNQGQNFGGMQS